MVLVDGRGQATCGIWTWPWTRHELKEVTQSSSPVVGTEIGSGHWPARDNAPATAQSRCKLEVQGAKEMS